jgi:hypothetical protein
VSVRLGDDRFLSQRFSCSSCSPSPAVGQLLPRRFAAISVMATSFFASARAMARIARCTEERGISVTSEIDARR